VTLETISVQTKIRMGLLQGLERDDLSMWPGGIFRRSYFRSYAAAIGLEPETAMREFLALYPEPAEESPAAILAEAESRRSGVRPRTRLHYLLASAIGAVSKPFDKERSASEVEPQELALHQMRAESAIEQTHEETLRDTGETDDAAGDAGANTLVETAVDIEDDVQETLELETQADLEEPSPIVQPDLAALAQLCTRTVQAGGASDLEALLGEAAGILRAVGIIVWPWDPARGVLFPSLSHGYPARTLARLPTLAADADNPIGAAFRSSGQQIVPGSGSATSALVAPLTTPRGCAGVLALEFANGLEQDATVQALATILAAQLSLPVEALQTLAEAPSRHAIA
jgi:hypothetical protein